MWGRALTSVLTIGLLVLAGCGASPPPSQTASGSMSSVAPSAAAATPEPGSAVPASVDGYPVLRGADIPAHIAADPSPTAFYVGGWLTSLEVDCAPPPSGRPTSPLAPWCPSGWFLTETRLMPGASGQGVPATVYLIVGTTVPGSGWQQDTPVILRVHAHDAQAATCEAAIRAECEQAVVVEAIAWSGASG